MPGGKPPYYETIEELEKKLEEYWIYIKGEQDKTTGEWNRAPEYPSVTGLALYLGFTTRQGLLNYEAKPEFVDAVKKSKLRVESAYEQALFGRNAAGPIFALKNFGWKDTQEIKHEVGGFMNIDPLDDAKTNDSLTEDSQAD